MKFDWNPDKNKSNIKKHGVDFEEAETVFQDEMALELFDGEHSEDEEIFQMIRELTEKDFERAVKNPHFEKLMTKVEVAITKKDWATFCEYAKINNVPPELIMRNGLSNWAKELRDVE